MMMYQLLYLSEGLALQASTHMLLEAVHCLPILCPRNNYTCSTVKVSLSRLLAQHVTSS